ncbi:hypothetical protein [Pelagibius sp. Alg239-R121]|uniref:hypothetical protein n=1 Tax=Pelagibius sp. Alg239-R121 TaxID=2993448 RepID=UPI0024A62BC0|nr:hypothetical protein [Pelagibius sp. Alg239-R121]
MIDGKSLPELQAHLEQVSQEMIGLIRTYDLDATSPFEVIKVAREKIVNQEDYVRFLELSLEGRIFGEAAAAVMDAEKNS